MLLREEGDRTTKPTGQQPVQETDPTNLIAVPITNNNGATEIVVQTKDSAITYDDAKATYASRYGVVAAENATTGELAQTTGKNIGVHVTKADVEELNDVNTLSSGSTIKKVNYLNSGDVAFRAEKGNDTNTLIESSSNTNNQLTSLDRLKLGVLSADQKPKPEINPVYADQITSENKINLAGTSQNQDAYLVNNPYTGGKSIVDSTGHIITGYTNVEKDYSPNDGLNQFVIPTGTTVGGKDITSPNTFTPDLSVTDTPEPTHKSYSPMTLPSDSQNGLLWGDKQVWVDPISLQTYKTIETAQEGLQYHTKELEFYNSIGIGGYGPLGTYSPLSRFAVSEILGFINMIPGTAMTVEATLQNPSGFDKELTKGRNTVPLNPVHNDNDELLLRGSNNIVQGSNVANSGLGGLLTIGSIKITPNLAPSNAIETVGTEAGYSRTPYIDSLLDTPNKIKSKAKTFMDNVEQEDLNEIKRIENAYEDTDYADFTGLPSREHTQYIMDRQKPGFVEQRNDEGLVVAWRTDTTIGGNYNIAKKLDPISDTIDDQIITVKPYNEIPSFKHDGLTVYDMSGPKAALSASDNLKFNLLFESQKTKNILLQQTTKQKSLFRSIEPESQFRDNVFGNSKSYAKTGYYDDFNGFGLIKQRKLGYSDTDLALSILNTGKNVGVNSKIGLYDYISQNNYQKVKSNTKIIPQPPQEQQVVVNLSLPKTVNAYGLQDRQVTNSTFDELVIGTTKKTSTARINRIPVIPPVFSLSKAGSGGANRSKNKAIKNTRNPVGDLTKLIGMTPTKKVNNKKKNKFRGLL